MKKMIFVLLAFIGTAAKSQWSSNPSINNIVSNRVGGEFDPTSVSDGAGGSIVVFIDYNNGDLYAQRITTTGAIAWASSSNPVTVCNSTGQKYEASAIADGAGGVFVAWSDYRHNPEIGEIYLQQISAAGAPLWAANGVRVTNNVNRDDMMPLLCLDGAGGVLLTWYGDDTVARTIQNYAQRYNSAGIAQWTADGVAVAPAAGFRASSSITADGAGGAYLYFVDTRNDPNGFDYDYLATNDLTNADIYGQRLSSSGSRLWGNEGTAIITAPGNQNDEIASDAIADGSGNTILVFEDGRNDPGDYSNYDVFAQKINSSGVPQWAANGVPVCNAAENQFVTGVVSDGAGGVVVSIDYTDISRLYAQRITSAGTADWAVNGVPVSPAGNIIYDASLVADGSGNSIFAFSDGNNSLLLAQKLNSAGILQWGAAGTVVCNQSDAYPSYPTITSSNAGSAIISWGDNRNAALSSMQDIYASKVLVTGVLAGTGASGYTSVADGNWNNPAIWLGNAVPPTGATVIIRHNVTGNVNTSCASVTVEAPGTLTVNPGVVIQVTN